MNPLKERRTVTTAKTITTLFISSALLVGFMAMSISLSQTASATAQGPPENTPPENPQCPDGADFERGQCIILECPGGFDPVIVDGRIVDCEKVTTRAPDQVCPNANKQVKKQNAQGETVCVAQATSNPNSGDKTVPDCADDEREVIENNVIVACEKVENADPIEETTRPGQGPERVV